MDKKNDCLGGLSVKYYLKKASLVSIIITSLSGKKIGGQNYGYQHPGSYSHFIDSKLNRGFYILNLKTDTQTETFKFLVK